MILGKITETLFCLTTCYELDTRLVFLFTGNVTETLFRHIGLNRLDEATALDISRLVGVDFLVLVVSVIVLAQCKSYQEFFDARKLAAEKEKEERAEEGSDREDRSRRDEGSDFEGNILKRHFRTPFKIVI